MPVRIKKKSIKLYENIMRKVQHVTRANVLNKMHVFHASFLSMEITEKSCLSRFLSHFIENTAALCYNTSPFTYFKSYDQ